FAGLESGVYPIRFRSHFVQKLLIPWNVCTARRTDLHERETPGVSRIHLYEALNTAETLQNSFGVVDAIHSHTQQRSLYLQFFAQLGAFFSGAPPFLARLPVGKSHANGIWPHPGYVPLPVNGEAVPFG